jgi:hypothetical protein
VAELPPIHEAIPGDLLKPMLEEFRSGWQLRKVQAEAARKLIGEANKRETSFVDGLGQLKARIPIDFYQHMKFLFGPDIWNDKKFLERVLQENPEFRPTVATKTQIIAPGLPFS